MMKKTRYCVQNTKKNKGIVRMENHQLKKIRRDIGFSMADIALCLGIPKSTYQRYEDGTSSIPSVVARGALELLQINKTFMAEAPARIDARIKAEYPDGIMSEV